MIEKKTSEEVVMLKKIAEAVKRMPFGESVALPWCRESFPQLDEAMKEWELYNEILMVV